MTNSPLHLKAETCDAIFQGSWTAALEDVTALANTVTRELEQPALKSLPEDRRRAHAERAYLNFIADALYASNVAMLMAMRQNVLSQPFIVYLEQQVGQFVIAAFSGRRFICDATPCEWRGTLEAVGPSGFCPSCGKQSLKPAPEIATSMPAAGAQPPANLNGAVLLAP